MRRLILILALVLAGCATAGHRHEPCLTLVPPEQGRPSLPFGENTPVQRECLNEECSEYQFFDGCNWHHCNGSLCTSTLLWCGGGVHSNTLEFRGGVSDTSTANLTIEDYQQ